MIDQNSQFFAILTAVGEAKQANATALGQPWTFSQMGVGDANGADPIPNRNQTRLINEWRRAAVNQVRTDPAIPNIIITEQVIPADVGGKWIREIGLYDADGDLVAVANCAPSFKPLLVQGTGKTQIIRMNFIVANTASVVLKIDPAIVLATREYVDTQIIEAMAKMDFKHSVLVATTANIALSGLQTIDGVLLPADSRVLVKNQTAGKENGLYVVSSTGVWKRAQDADSSVEVTPGLFVSVEAGTLNGDSVWQLVTDAPIVLGTTALAFEMAVGRTGVSAGSYANVTVDKCGRVIAGTNPTTLAGHGITDAYTKDQITAMITQASEDQRLKIAAVVGTHRNLKLSASGLSALVNVSADQLIVGAADIGFCVSKINLSFNGLAGGANGLDTGVLAASSWYSVWVIWDGSTTAGLLSLSATAPAMPAGYTHKARVGWIRTDSTANKYPLSFVQRGDKSFYVPAAGTNLLSPPSMAAGVLGNVNTPTWSPFSVDAFIPPTASIVKFFTAAYAQGIVYMVADSNAYGVYNSATNPPPVMHNTASPGADFTQFGSSLCVGPTRSLFCASNTAAFNIRCLGWEDNL